MILAVFVFFEDYPVKMDKIMETTILGFRVQASWKQQYGYGYGIMASPIELQAPDLRRESPKSVAIWNGPQREDLKMRVGVVRLH